MVQEKAPELWQNDKPRVTELVSQTTSREQLEGAYGKVNIVMLIPRKGIQDTPNEGKNDIWAPVINFITNMRRKVYMKPKRTN